MPDQDDRTPLPEPPECAPDQPGGMPDILSGHESAAVAIRATYRVTITERAARRIEQLVEQLAEEDGDGVSVEYGRMIQAAAVDLLNVAALLDFYADHCGDGVERENIPIAALVMEVRPEVERIAERLMEAVSAAAEEQP